jgi:predicted amidohydrolase YtcJ
MKNFADIIIFNADIWTADESNPNAKALALKDNIILAVGSEQEILKYSNSHTKQIDANGRSVLPGFIDSHMHLIEGGIFLTRADFRDCRSKEEFQTILAKYYLENREAKWLIGGNWNHELWGGEMPDASWIDEIIPNMPVWLSRMDGHIGLANSEAMKIAGIEDSTTFTNGGYIRKNKQGKPNGIFADNAMKLVTKYIPPISIEDKTKALNVASNYLLSQGITSVHFMPLFDKTDTEAIENAYRDKKLKLRVYTGYPIDFIDLLEQKIEEYGIDNDFLKFGFVKAFADGSLGSQTALMFEPYLNTDNYGLETLDFNEYYAKIIDADLRGHQIVTHAIGDKANFTVASFYGQLSDKNGKRDRRLRIEHAQMINDETIQLMAQHNIVASMQTVHLLDEIGWSEKIIGHERLKEAYRVNSLLKEGVKVALGSDWFVAIPNPFWGIYAATTRSKLSFYDEKGWVGQEKISIEQALYGYTRDAAFASFDENKKAQIKEGFLADIVILNNNIFKAEPEDLKYILVETTILDGKIVYKRK